MPLGQNVRVPDVFMTQRSSTVCLHDSAGVPQAL
jgi:hypothetical protein